VLALERLVVSRGAAHDDEEQVQLFAALAFDRHQNLVRLFNSIPSWLWLYIDITSKSLAFKLKVYHLSFE
jgi:hypothetical protein